MSVSVDLEEIKSLRDKTGSGIMDCKRALEEAGGDVEKALSLLRQQGLVRAQEKQERATAEGAICTYIHLGDKLGVMLELACETDFVARNSVFRELATEAAMQTAALAPDYISPEDMPPEVKEEQLETYRREALTEGKTEKIAQTIAEGKLKKFYQQVCLLEQPSIRDDKIPFKEIIAEAAAKVGENIRVKRFARFRVGERTQIAHAS
jgi:elongation factor Ts